MRTQVLIRVLGTKVAVAWPIPIIYHGLCQIVLGPLALRAFGEQWRGAYSSLELAALGAMGFIAFLSAIALTLGMQNEKSASANVINLIGLPCSFVFQTLITKEPLRARTLAGTALIISSLALVIYASHRDTTPRVLAPQTPTSSTAPRPAPRRRRSRTKNEEPSFSSLPMLSTDSYERHVNEPHGIEMPERAANADAEQASALV